MTSHNPTEESYSWSHSQGCSSSDTVDDASYVEKLAPTSCNEPCDVELKDLYSLNKIARAKKNQIQILGGGTMCNLVEVGSFFNDGDSRANVVKLSCEINGNVTKTLSFDTAKMKCCLCNESVGHKELARLGARGGTSRMVFAVATASKSSELRGGTLWS